MTLDKILVGVDFSDSSEAATEHALALASPRNSEIILGHVGAARSYLPQWPEPIEAHKEFYNEVFAALLGESRDKLEALRAKYSRPALALSQTVIPGVPPYGLSDAAKELDAGLVCVGSKGRTGLKRALLGSVAEQVIRVAQTDVLVARGPAPTEGYRRILVLAGLAADEIVTTRAAEFASPLGAKIDIMHFWRLPAAAEKYWTEATPAETTKSLSDTLVEAVEAKGRALVSPLIQRSSASQVQFEHRESPVKRGIVSALDDNDFDLIVVGGRFPSSMRDRLSASIAVFTARHAKCAVLVARPSGTKERKT